MPRRVPRLRKCRRCWRNFDPAHLVVDHNGHDERGYPIPPTRWCRPCADTRLAELEAGGHPVDAENAERLSRAIGRYDRAQAAAS